VRLAGQDVVVLVLTAAQLIGLLVVMWIKWRKSQKFLLCELPLSLSHLKTANKSFSNILLFFFSFHFLLQIIASA
jgi:hypothetical protein